MYPHCFQIRKAVIKLKRILKHVIVKLKICYFCSFGGFNKFIIHQPKEKCKFNKFLFLLYNNMGMFYLLFSTDKQNRPNTTHNWKGCYNVSVCM